MTDHDSNPIKYCYDCEFHFKAKPGQHRKTYHPNEKLFMYVRGTWRDAEIKKFS